MKCQQVQENLELYLAGELDSHELQKIEEHLKSCAECQKQLEEVKNLVSGLKELKNNLMLKEGVSMKLKEQFLNQKPEKKRGMALSTVVAGISLGLFMLSSSLLAFPAFAEKYTPNLPLVQNVKELKSEVNQLKVQIKKIKDTELRVVETKPSLTQEENTAVQAMVLDFVKAQYAGDLEKMKSLASEEFYKEILTRKDEFIRSDRQTLAFGSITNVAKEGDLYLVFVRLSDSVTGDSEIQENFMLKNINGNFVITNVENDV